MCTGINMLLIVTLALLIAGLIRPWWVLWWMSTQNRLKVIILYGSTGFVLLVMRALVC